MNIPKQTLVLSIAGCSLQLFFIFASFIGADDSFAVFWTSCGFAYVLLAFHVVTGVVACYDIKHPLQV
ncbi:hypothetical protein [Enterobacter hormaechei]|uniref:hypothetical protein n=1 Tax=Enterobacter hormaechei TaxID=158836 RepID=UPI001141A442|nr:hypothetical protein [Enterobacter hormaechei]